MKAYNELTGPEHARVRDRWEFIKRKTSRWPKDRWFEGLKIKRGYASYTFSGIITEELIEALGRKPDPDDIIMMLEDGYRHGGGTCTINGRSFNGRVHANKEARHVRKQ